MKKEMVAILTNKTKGNRSLQEFTDALKEGIPGLEITRQTVHNWTTAAYLPNLWTLVKLILETNDWRAEYAAKALAIFDPDTLNFVRKFYNKEHLDVYTAGITNGKNQIDTKDQPQLKI